MWHWLGTLGRKPTGGEYVWGNITGGPEYRDLDHAGDTSQGQHKVPYASPTKIITKSAPNEKCYLKSL